MRLKWIYTSFFVKRNCLCFQTRRFHYFSEDGYDVDGPRPFEVSALCVYLRTRSSLALLSLIVNVFSTQILIKETIFTSPTGCGISDLLLCGQVLYQLS